MPANKTSIHFDISERKVLLRLIDIAVVLAMLYMVSQLFNFDYFKINAVHWVWSIVLGIYLTIFATIFELYNLQKAGKFEVTIQNIILTTSVTVLFYLLTPFFTPELPENRLQIVYFYISINLSLILWRYVYVTFVSAARFNKRVLLIADGPEIERIIDSLEASDPNYKVVGYVKSGENNYTGQHRVSLLEFKNSELFDLVKEHTISEVVVAAPAYEGITLPLYNQLLHMLESGVSIREYTQVYEDINRRVPVQQIDQDFYKFFPFSRSNQNKLYLFFHRGLDLFLSVIGLVLGLLLSPIVFIGNIIGNRGPLFYTQERVGKNGIPFKIFKLRSMVVDAEKTGAQFAQKGDIRVTKFGRFLRNTRLDEIPQFLNVIKGEMSIIGPRPERTVFVNELSEKIPFYEVRHLVKPGVTGWAQVNADYGSTDADALRKLQFDLYYIKHRSFFLDISIIVKTLSTIIFYRGQ
ncbi:MAG: exopolysaccharide biosynthesis polyprenyl glycosylphosphotransferase [Patiriisocius sp.]|jgi:exopolysaccharide biosynthesis polyprenyl glycosylphosphotransferase